MEGEARIDNTKYQIIDNSLRPQIFFSYDGYDFTIYGFSVKKINLLHFFFNSH